ncbi:MAG: hypothetical protein J5501_09235 [Ruminococcus sp.]|nr:hypothetical protein [Ruminococcus sp.]
MFEEDYIIRQIKECVAAAMKLVFNIDTPTRASLIIKSEEKQKKLTGLLKTSDEGRIREAVEELHRAAKDRTFDDLLMGMDFYTHLCEIDDDKLAAENMKYSDIKADMSAFFHDFGLAELADLILFEG